WKAAPGEDVKLQFKTEAASGDTMRADQITMTAIKLSDDLTEGADWYFNERTTDTALAPSYKTGNSASVTFTPNGSNDWLVLATAGEINLDTTDNFATSTRVATTTITPANAGDVWCLGFYIYDINSASYARGRMQIDNADQPPTQTSDFYGVPDATWDVTDEYGVAFQTIEKMTALPHTLDLDATTVTPVKPVEDRLAMCVTMQLAP